MGIPPVSDYNIAIGSQCLEQLQSGDNNIGIGYLIGSSLGNFTGNDNVFIGGNSGTTSAAPTGCVVLGASSAAGDNAIAIGYGVIAVDNSIVIGDGSHTSVVIGGVDITGGAPLLSATFATLPAAAANNGKTYFVSDVGLGGSLWYSNGTDWSPVNGAVILAKSGVPSGIAPSGTVAANGALTLGTALNITYNAGIFLYFPAGAVYAGSLAGSYWCLMSSTTLGTIYDDVLGTGWTSESVPAVPTPIVAAGPGAYVGSTVEVTLTTLNNSGGILGNNGSIRSFSIKSVNNTANAKTYRERFSGNSVEASNLLNTITNISQLDSCAGGNSTSVIVKPASTSSLGNFGGAIARLSINTAIDFTYTATAQLATATDTFVLEELSVELIR
jgi:hypothetical protein